MIYILEKVCNYIESEKKSHNHELRDAIEEYIISNYHHNNLSISLIADNFNMNPAYLSRFFKEQTGQGLLDYINKIRVERAKELLIKTNITVSETAQAVGFYNSNALIRVFKKYEGITPGQYKEYGG